MEKSCTKCGHIFPETRDYFGQFRNMRGGEVVIGFRNTCRGCMRIRSAAHAKAKPEQRRERMARRIDRETVSPNAPTPSGLNRIREALGDSCRYCGNALHGGGETDHLTPVARGGTDALSNLTLACMPCNRAKLSKTLEEFLEWRRERGLEVKIRTPDYEQPDEPHHSVQRRTYR